MQNEHNAQRHLPEKAEDYHAYFQNLSLDIYALYDWAMPPLTGQRDFATVLKRYHPLYEPRKNDLVEYLNWQGLDIHEFGSSGQIYALITEIYKSHRAPFTMSNVHHTLLAGHNKGEMCKALADEQKHPSHPFAAAHKKTPPCSGVSSLYNYLELLFS